MKVNWDDFGPAPASRDPLTQRGGLRTEAYPMASGGAFPEGWSVSEWLTDFEETPLWDAYEDHVSKNMELTILLSDWNAMRGSGKTTLSVKLARKFDRTDEGLTPEKVTNEPEAFVNAYVDQPQGSGMVFDEAEAGVNARDAMTTVNKELNEKVSMGRVGEKYAIWNMPFIGQIDKEMRMLAHYWILVRRRGRARVYELSNDPHEDKTYTKPICEIEWSKLPENDAVYAALDEHKWTKLEDDADGWVPEEEHRKQVEQARKEAQREQRDEFIVGAYGNNLLTQPEIAEITDLDQSQVSRIWRNKKDEVLV